MLTIYLDVNCGITKDEKSVFKYFDSSVNNKDHTIGQLRLVMLNLLN